MIRLRHWQKLDDEQESNLSLFHWPSAHSQLHIEETLVNRVIFLYVRLNPKVVQSDNKLIIYYFIRNSFPVSDYAYRFEVWKDFLSFFLLVDSYNRVWYLKWEKQVALLQMKWVLERWKKDWKKERKRKFKNDKGRTNIRRSWWWLTHHGYIHERTRQRM